MKKQFLLWATSSPTDGVWRWEDSPTFHHYDTAEDFRTKERYEEYKNAGLNTLMLQGNDPYNGEPWECSQLKKNMDNAYEAGIDKIFLYDKRIFDYSEYSGGIIGEDKPFKDEKELDEFIQYCIKDYSHHPAFIGIMLVDEPRWYQIQAASEIIRACHRVKPDMFVHCCCLPLYRNSEPLYVENGKSGNGQAMMLFEEYIRNYLKLSEQPYVLYDSYPMRADNDYGVHILKDHLPGLQITADILKEENKDFYFVLQTCAYYTWGRLRFRKCGDKEMRWQINSVLPFGVKAISYYTYWCKQQNALGGYHIDGTSFMYRDGRKAPLYDVMKKIHEDLGKITPYLLDCRYIDSTYYTNFEEVPYLIKGMKKRECRFIKNIKLSQNATIIVSVMKNEATNETVLGIFNANDCGGPYKEATKVEIELSSKIKKVFSLKNENDIKSIDGKFILEAGDCNFLVLETKGEI